MVEGAQELGGGSGKGGEVSRSLRAVDFKGSDQADGPNIETWARSVATKKDGIMTVKCQQKGSPDHNCCSLHVGLCLPSLWLMWHCFGK